MLIVVEHTSPGRRQAPPHAHEKEVCLVCESETQTSQRVAIQEGEEYLEVMSMDQGACVLLVGEGGSSSSTVTEVPEDVEESAPVQNEKNTQPVDIQSSELGVASAASDEVECCNIVQEEVKPRFQQLPLTTDT